MHMQVECMFRVESVFSFEVSKRLDHYRIICAHHIFTYTMYVHSLIVIYV